MYGRSFHMNSFFSMYVTPAKYNNHSISIIIYFVIFLSLHLLPGFFYILFCHFLLVYTSKQSAYPRHQCTHKRVRYQPYHLLLFVISKLVVPLAPFCFRPIMLKEMCSCNQEIIHKQNVKHFLSVQNNQKPHIKLNSFGIA